MEFQKPYPNHPTLPFLSPKKGDFEALYVEVRGQEGRLYADNLVRVLPHLPKEHPHYAEWKLRVQNTERFLKRVQVEKPNRVLDLGCGNGWFTHLIAEAISGEVLGVDINAYELEQAIRLFQSPNCQFAYGDVFHADWVTSPFDLIVLNSCVQYFPDIESLLDRLQMLLNPNGSIHILDSPIYHASQVEAARKRSLGYYTQVGVDGMGQHYHHHTWESLQRFNPKILYQADHWTARLKRKLLGEGTPFSWIVIPFNS